ncbi:RIP metalloprotease RseP [bacterium]|nr:RIP metalloprotease RseP [bacterium]
MAIIKMILLIGFLIFVHELGHFLVARMFGIKVDRFCFGLPFGPILFEKKIGEVTYGVHLLFFLGGYVSFPDDDKDNGLPKDSPLLFKNRPAYQQACVLVAGVTANLITAYAIVLFCCMHWGFLPSGNYNVYVDDFYNAPAATLNSGLKIGDKYVSINGKNLKYPHELTLVSLMSKKFDNKITFEQQQRVMKEFLALNKDLNEESVIEKGQTVNIPKTVEEDKIVLTDSDIFGLKQNKKYITLDKAKQRIRNYAFNKSTYTLGEEIPVKDFVTAIADTYSPIDIVVERNGEEVNINTLYSGLTGCLYIVSRTEENKIQINGFKDAIIATQDYMWENTKLMGWSLKLLIMGQVPMEKMTSVIAITKIGSEIIEKSGMMKGLLLTAIISLNLAMLNILPIPALDGGHLMFLIIEKIKGSPVDEKVVEKISNFFFYLLIALILLFVVNDLLSIFVRKIY